MRICTEVYNEQINTQYVNTLNKAIQATITKSIRQYPQQGNTRKGNSPMARKTEINYACILLPYVNHQTLVKIPYE